MLTRIPSSLLTAVVLAAGLLLPASAAAGIGTHPDDPVALDPACASALLERLGPAAADGIDVLGCDDDGGSDPRGRVVVAVGDLAAAEHVVVLVPGCDSDLASLTPVPRDRRAGGTPLDWARTLARAAGPRTVVVLWVGYRTPVGPGPAAATSGRARAAVPALIEEVTALEALAPHRRSTAVVGHSYGAVVVALAAHDLAVDDLVLLGSPGAHASTAADLHSSARVWAATAPTDWVGRLPHVEVGGLGHGTDPASAAFGTLPLPTGGVAAHDGYLRPGSATLAALATLVTGTPSATIKDVAPTRLPRSSREGGGVTW